MNNSRRVPYRKRGFYAQDTRCLTGIYRRLFNIYSKEFREEAVKLVLDEGLKIPEAAKRLDVPKSTISNWVRASKAGKLGDIG